MTPEINAEVWLRTEIVGVQVAVVRSPKSTVLLVRKYDNVVASFSLFEDQACKLECLFQAKFDPQQNFFDKTEETASRARHLHRGEKL